MNFIRVDEIPLTSAFGGDVIDSGVGLPLLTILVFLQSSDTNVIRCTGAQLVDVHQQVVV